MLVAELEGVSLPHSGEVAGTPAYMSPEQAEGHPATAACDWYSVGTMLYEAVCGKRPFSGSMLRILQAKQTTERSAQ